MGYQKLYFENSTYKYYVRKHMQVLIIQKKVLHKHFKQRSGKVMLLAGKTELLRTESYHD